MTKHNVPIIDDGSRLTMEELPRPMQRALALFEKEEARHGAPDASIYVRSTEMQQNSLLTTAPEGSGDSNALSLGVLDQSPIRQGGTAAQALRETIELAQAVERFGYTRYWVAEHHNTGSFAGTAPEILIGQIAAHTSTIRVGSGGVMLTHYSALKVAETFRLLSALYPGRIDLGIGRAPGSDQKTALALAYPRPLSDINAFPRQVTDLVGFLSHELPESHPFADIEAQAGPLPDELPDVWLLGSSDYSARLAAMLGLPFAFADFFGNAGDFGPQIADLYRQQFEPSHHLQQPKLAAAVHVVCADTQERAHYIASSMRLAVARMRTGATRIALLDPAEASRLEEEMLPRLSTTGFTKHYIEGDPTTVRTQLLAAAERYGANNLIVATNCFSFEDRVHSYQLVAEAFAGAAVMP